MNPSFGDFDLPSNLLLTLEKSQFRVPTPVQAQAIPHALKGRDILGTAQTGTGKTAAFGIPLLSTVFKDPTKFGLVLAPTRELAAQINGVLRKFAKPLKMRGALVVGGESFGRQVRELEDGVDYVVATPGRLNDHLERQTVDLSAVSMLVLDEMDRMLDMGFAPQIKKIMKFIPDSRQTLLFSATLPEHAAELANRLLKTPVRVKIEPVKNVVPIKEERIQTTQRDKGRVIGELLGELNGKTLIFTRTKSRTEKVARNLGNNGFRVVNLHGGRTQGQRKRALEMFRKGSHPVLVATDVAGRGIDVVDVEQVINYDLPQCFEDYVHRIGRTGRNGRSGRAISFVTEDDADAEAVLTGKKSPKAKRLEGQSKARGGRRRRGKGKSAKGKPRHRKGARRPKARG